MKQSEEELSPCPFCGEEAKLVIQKQEKKNPKLYSICCSNRNCEYTTTGFLYELKKHAIESWNKRSIK